MCFRKTGTRHEQQLNTQKGQLTYWVLIVHETAQLKTTVKVLWSETNGLTFSEKVKWSQVYGGTMSAIVCCSDKCSIDPCFISPLWMAIRACLYCLIKGQLSLLFSVVCVSWSSWQNGPTLEHTQFGGSFCCYTVFSPYLYGHSPHIGHSGRHHLASTSVLTHPSFPSVCLIFINSSCVTAVCTAAAESIGKRHWPTH